MTIVYFIRHAEPDYNNHDDMTRELSAKGWKDSKLVTDFLVDKKVDVVLSSPYRRAMDTVRDLAEVSGFMIETVDDFRERKIDNAWIENITAFCKNQWNDYDYKLSDGESLREVQE